VSRWARARLPLLLMFSLAAGCHSAPLRIESHAGADLTSTAPERFIIAGVENDPVAFLGRAGSTPRGYDAVTTYGPTTQARQVLRSLESEYGLREVSAWPIEPLHMHCAILEVPAGTDSAALLVKLSNDRRLKLAQPLQTFATRTETYNDPYVGLQRGFQQMDVADAHPWSRGEGVKVAIIDTGADTEHPDLRGAIVSAANFVDADERQFRLDRHGTEIAGVIAAIANNGMGIVGVAPGAHLMMFKACWQARADADAAQCNSFTLARALVAAFEARAQVVNLSIAGPEDPLLGDLIKEGLRRGIVFVGAAAPGARAGDSLLHQAGVIEVAASESASPDAALLSAPGREILTLLPEGHYDFASGVSIATAEVTGVVALLLSQNGGLSAGAAYRLLQQTSSRTAGGAGRVDACAAVTSLVGRGSCNDYAKGDHPANGDRLAGKAD
jgi:subtilisin family serine protease